MYHENGMSGIPRNRCRASDLNQTIRISDRDAGSVDNGRLSWKIAGGDVVACRRTGLGQDDLLVVDSRAYLNAITGYNVIHGMLDCGPWCGE